MHKPSSLETILSNAIFLIRIWQKIRPIIVWYVSISPPIFYGQLRVASSRDHLRRDISTPPPPGTTTTTSSATATPLPRQSPCPSTRVSFLRHLPRPTPLRVPAAPARPRLYGGREVLRPRAREASRRREDPWPRASSNPWRRVRPAVSSLSGTERVERTPSPRPVARSLRGRGRTCRRGDAGVEQRRAACARACEPARRSVPASLCGELFGRRLARRLCARPCRATSTAACTRVREEAREGRCRARTGDAAVQGHAGGERDPPRKVPPAASDVCQAIRWLRAWEPGADGNHCSPPQRSFGWFPFPRRT